ncbi:hypothetical protein H8E52_10670 [bacterium]|nr:hypothetical protein [bacterium]
MKKILLFAVILTFTAGMANAQFAAGTKSLGGTVSYYKNMTEDAEDSMISFAPMGGYFFMDNLMIYVTVDYTKYTFDSDTDMTETGFGAGVKYFINYLYLGAGYDYAKMSDSSDTEYDALTGLLFEGGYLYPITDYFFLDLGVDYYFGMTELGVDPNTYKQKGLVAGFGFATFF